MANITMIQNEAKYKPTTEELIKSNFFNDKRSNRISKSYRFALDTELEKLDVVGLKRLEILLRVWFSTQITVFHKTQQIKTCFFFVIQLSNESERENLYMKDSFFFFEKKVHERFFF